MAIARNGVRVFAPAKINLFLHVGAKRADGYHDLQSLVAFVEKGDAVELEEADSLSLDLDGPFAGALAGDNGNLVLKAVRSFAESVGRRPNTRIRLTKNLPVASGIGGGSADAAATLRGLATVWDTPGATFELAASIGSDVPVCLASRTAWMEGRGERIAILRDLPPANLVLVNPGTAVSTFHVFGRLVQRSGIKSVLPPRDPVSVYELADYLREFRNDLEAPAQTLAPVIGETLRALRSRGALLARMSGSGATCFGLYSNAENAEEAERAISREFPLWWVRATRIAPQAIGLPQKLDQ